MNQWADFHELWYEHNAIGGHSNRVIFNFLYLIIKIRRMHELLMWKRHLVYRT